ncbi:MAG: protoporphyrinogen oxidase [Chloroflexota bacterium]
MTHVTIIGGGIAGLATAFYLQKKSREAGLSIDYTLIEQSPRFGGKIITTTTPDGFVIEGGPDSFITQKPWGTQLCRDLGVADRLIPTNDHRRDVYVVNRGRLTPFPGGFRLAIPTEFIPFALSPLISPWGKLRMGLDLFIPPRRENGDESLANFFRRRLGSEAVDKIAGPMMGGIYTADPERLSIDSTFPMFVEMERKYGSLIKAMQAGKKKQPPPGSSNGQPPAMFTSLRGGMDELVETLVSQLEGDLRPGCRVAGLRYRSPGFEVLFDPADRPPLATGAVVLAVPAYAAAPLVEALEPELARRLGQVRYISTANISLAYRYSEIRSQHDLNGFGFMIPKSEGRQILACTWTSTKFNSRVPADGALLRVFFGGEGREHQVDLPDEELMALARAEVADLMGVTAQPLAHRIFRWPRGNPQYDVGHLERVAGMEALAARLPGLFLTGSAFRGIGIPDCVKSGLNTVEQIMTYVVTTYPHPPAPFPPWGKGEF